MRSEGLTPSAYVLEKSAEKRRNQPLATKYGNASGIPRQATARKMKQVEKEKRVLGGKRSAGVYENLKRLKEEFAWKFKVKGDTAGYIRQLSEVPFHCCLWRHEQLMHAN